jgi:hypothetical protein
LKSRPEIGTGDLCQFFKTGFSYGQNWLGEDVHFCKLCKHAGIDIWCDPDINLKHSGRTEYSGNFHEYLLSLPPIYPAGIDNEQEKKQ